MEIFTDPDHPHLAADRFPVSKPLTSQASASTSPNSNLIPGEPYIKTQTNNPTTFTHPILPGINGGEQIPRIQAPHKPSECLNFPQLEPHPWRTPHNKFITNNTPQPSHLILPGIKCNGNVLHWIITHSKLKVKLK